MKFAVSALLYVMNATVDPMNPCADMACYLEDYRPTSLVASNPERKPSHAQTDSSDSVVPCAEWDRDRSEANMQCHISALPH